MEFWSEESCFPDFKHLNLVLNRTDIPNYIPALISVTPVPAEDNRREWLFPQNEINTNPAIVQKRFYDIPGELPISKSSGKTSRDDIFILLAVQH